MGRWRAAVLIAVHVLIAAHVVQWLITGTTLSPVEPSESMLALELGAVNAGLLFFVAAILSTVLFGRFFCGWGCHVVALQDLCGAWMRRLGCRPKPFRSRLLVWVPLILGTYMFIWPTFKREALLPAMRAVGIERPAWLRGLPEFHGFYAELFVTDFWATFPPWYVAIPFFLVIGFAAVYFLGSKGFCTYGCPYGGIFGVVDRVSVGRIKVNDSCDGSAHCTAVCTSNVRVHEEVRDFGAVVNPGCMKCLDCVTACPNDALSFSFGAPSLFDAPRTDEAGARVASQRKNPKRFDLTWPEELAIAGVFLLLFLGYRGFLNQIPMLMAVGMAGVGAFLVWTAWSLLRRPNVRIQRAQLKYQGRWRASGVVVFLVALVTIASAAWGAAVNNLRWRAHIAHESIAVPIQVALRDTYAPSPATDFLASEAVSRFGVSGPWGDGGVGWRLAPRDARAKAFALLVSGDLVAAAEALEFLIETGVPTDELVRHYGSILVRSGASREAFEAAYTSALERHPGLAEIRGDIVRLRVTRGLPASEAMAEWTDRLDSMEIRTAEAAREVALAALVWAELREPELASALLARMPESRRLPLGTFVLQARVLAFLGRTEESAALLEGIEVSARHDPSEVRAAATLLRQLGRLEASDALLKEGMVRYPDALALSELALQIAVSEADPDAAAIHAASAGAILERRGANQAWAFASLGETVVRAGLTLRNRDLADRGIGFMERGVALAPDAPTMLHDAGQALVAVGRVEEGLERVRLAAALAPGSEALSASLARLEARLGQRTGE
ncbi:MAG: 4Fe-4S binding protein [Planctomycetota bacterium]